MVKIDEIIKRIELFAPLSTQQAWDNSGWQIEPCEENTEKFLLTLDVNDESVKFAINNGCNLIISHHPIFFSPVKSLKQSFITEIIRNKIAVYCAHTNLDVAPNGVNDSFAAYLGFEKLKNLNDFVKFKILDTKTDMNDFIKEIKSKLKTKTLKITNLNKKDFSSIAFCCGSGGEFTELVDGNKIDVYLTGDLKYHQVQCAKHATIIDTGHYNSEICAINVLKNILADLDAEAITFEGKDVFEYI